MTTRPLSGVRTLLALVAISGGAGVAAPVHAQAPRTEIGAGVTHDRLDNGFPDWSGSYAEALHRRADGTALFGLLRRTERVNLRDNELQAGAALRLAPAWLGALEGTVSDTHRVLPKHALQGALTFEAGHGWNLTGALRQTDYTNDRVRLASVLVEKYTGPWRFAAAGYFARLNSAADAGTGKLQADWYYGDTSFVGAAVAIGEDLESLGPAGGVLRTQVKSLVVAGRHALAPRWSLDWGVEVTEQGRLYDRNGVRLGVRYRLD